MDIKYQMTLFFVLLFLATPIARAQDKHALEHGGQVFHAFTLETGTGFSNSKWTTDWDFDGWIGTDENKLWLVSEGEHTNKKTEHAEFLALYSRNVSPFWDAQIGIRHDIEPTSLTYFALGIEGLAPHFFETKAHLFISEDGDVSARLRQEVDLLITQRLITQPYIEANLYAQDIDKIKVGAGLSNATFGVQTRYEITRKLAPYIDLSYDRKFGSTSSLAKKEHDENDAYIATAGLRIMF